jgi:hypothetical protein
MAFSFALFGASVLRILSIPASIITYYNNDRVRGRIIGGFTDSLGNSYINIEYSNGGSTGGFVNQKISSSNSVIWSKYFPNSYGGANGLDCDAAGNLYVGGFYGDYPGQYFALYTKYNSDGALQWQRHRGGGQTYSDNISINKGGYSSMSSTTNGGTCHMFLIDTNGNTVISRTVGGSVYGQGYAGMATTAALVGYTNQICVYSLTGSYLFGKTAGFAYGIRGTGDSENNFYTWAFGTSTSNVVYVTKWNSSGIAQWHRSITTPSGYLHAESSSGTCDSNNNVYIPMFRKTIAESGDNSSDFCMVSFDKDGNVRYQRSMSSSAKDQSSTVNINEAINSGFIGGAFNGDRSGALVTFDLTTGSAAGTATVGGVAVTFAANNLTIATISSPAYSNRSDFGGSSSLSGISRGGDGGNGFYTINRATFS